MKLQLPQMHFLALLQRQKHTGKEKSTKLLRQWPQIEDLNLVIAIIAVLLNTFA